jgi:metal-responsive CopG/Arc/MetJ family transcriptional regulator
MNTGSVRLNVTIPKDLAQSMDDYIGSGKRSRFVAEAIKALIDKKLKEKMTASLEEGYKATAKESREFAGEFENVDLEGWDDY